MPTNPNLTYGKVTGFYSRVFVDGADTDAQAENMPIEGLTVLFTPSQAVLVNKAAKATIQISAFPATTDENGYICTLAGDVGIELPASIDPAINETGWTWNVTISGAGYIRETYAFTLASGQEIDLSTVVKLPSSVGTSIVQWEAAVTATYEYALEAGASVEEARALIAAMPEVPTEASDIGAEPAGLSAATKAAQSATFVPRWAPLTAYPIGAKVVSPSGVTVSAKVAFTSGAAYDATNWDLPADFTTPAQSLRVAPNGLDQTVGMFGLQKIPSRKWFQKEIIFGNNLNLSAHPRQPFQNNQRIDGSTFIAGEYGSDVVGSVNAITFKGGFLGEVALGAANPHDVVGGNDYILSGLVAGDLAGITSFYARLTEAHVKTPDAILGTVSAQNFQTTLENGAHADNAYGAFVHPPTASTGGSIDNGYNVYLRKPTTGSPTNYWSLFAEGKSEFAGIAKFTGATPSTSGVSVLPGVYVGRDTGSGATVELSNGTSNIQIANSLTGQLEVRLAGTRVMFSVTTAGALNMDGSGSFGRSTQAPTPGTQAATKGAYVGRSAGGTVGVELGDGTNSFRMANSGSNELVFERSGVAQLGKFNASGDFFISKGLAFVPTTQTAAPAAGAGSALPATPAGYADVTIGGTLRKIAYY